MSIVQASYFLQALGIVMFFLNGFAYVLTMRPKGLRRARRRRALKILRVIQSSNFRNTILAIFGGYRGLVELPGRHYTGWLEKHLNAGRFDLSDDESFWAKKWYQWLGVSGLFLFMVVCAAFYDPVYWFPVALFVVGDMIRKSDRLKFAVRGNAYSPAELCLLAYYVGAAVAFLDVIEAVTVRVYLALSVVLAVPILHAQQGIFWNSADFYWPTINRFHELTMTHLTRLNELFVFMVGVAASFALSAITLMMAEPAYFAPGQLQSSEFLAVNAVLDGATFYVTYRLFYSHDFKRAISSFGRIAADVLISLSLSLLACGALLLLYRETVDAFPIFSVVFGMDVMSSGRISAEFLLTHTSFLPIVSILGLLLIVQLNALVLRAATSLIAIFSTSRDTLRGAITAGAYFASGLIAASFLIRTIATG